MKSASANPETLLYTFGRKLLSVTAGIGLLAGGWAAQANELINPNLDVVAVGPQFNITPTSWNVYSWKSLSGINNDGCSSESWCNKNDGGAYGLFFKPFQGNVTLQDLISVYFYQDVATAPGTKFTLSGYAAGEANFCALFATNEPAPKVYFVVEFRDASDNGLVTNLYDLVANGLPTSGPGSMAIMTTPQFTAPAGTAKVRAGAYMLNAYSTTGSQSFFVDAFDLAAEAPAGAPVITQQPAHTTVSAGDTAKFTVVLSNPTGVTYEWMKDGTALADGGNISGATTATLSVANASAADVGRYRVRVTNTTGSVLSSEGNLALTAISFYPVISITGKINDTYVVEYSTKAAPATWIPLSTNKLTTVPQMVIDSTSPMDNTRFYRALYQQP